MLKRLVAAWAILAIAFALVAWLLPGVRLHGGFFGVLWVSALFAVVNLFIGSFVRLITAPIMLLSLGLFGILVNALMLRLVSWWSVDLDIDGWGSAILAAILLAVLTWLLGLTPLGGPKRAAKRH
jgi:putative membrane protein